MPNPKVPFLYPKRKERGLQQAVGPGADSVINNIIEQTIEQVSSTITTLDDVADGTNYKRVAASQLSGGIYAAATTSAKGIIEIATTAETNTGTDATRTVSPDGLAGSVMGTKVIGVIAVDATTDLSVADGKAYIPIPAAMNGMNLTRAQAIVITAGTTNATTIDIYNVTVAQDMLSTAISIASGATVGTVGTINATYDNVATNDVLRIDVTTMSTTAPKGLLIILEFSLP